MVKTGRLFKAEITLLSGPDQIGNGRARDSFQNVSRSGAFDEAKAKLNIPFSGDFLWGFSETRWYHEKPRPCIRRGFLC